MMTWQEHDYEAASIITKYWRFRRKTWYDFAAYGEHLYQMGKIDGAKEVIRRLENYIEEQNA